MNRALSSYAAAMIATLTLAAVPANADAERGKIVFKKCKACHLVDKEKNRTGPHLVGLFGRDAGSLKGYRYSKAMKAAKIVWEEETLDAYLKSPRKYVKGTKMAFAGLRKPEDRAALIAYLKIASDSSAN
jgi:cytochrome c2